MRVLSWDWQRFAGPIHTGKRKSFYAAFASDGVWLVGIERVGCVVVCVRILGVKILHGGITMITTKKGFTVVSGIVRGSTEFIRKLQTGWKILDSDEMGLVTMGLKD